MDIVVTIPKSEYANDDTETTVFQSSEEYEQFWTLHRMPTKLHVGDRVYFVKNKRIESSMEVTRLERNHSQECEVTNRTWSGNCILYLSDLKEEKIEMEVKGFQGFRYRWW